MEGKIQHHTLKKVHNMEVLISELRAKELDDKFNDMLNWTNHIKLLKDNERDKKFFRPHRRYDSFK